MRLSQPHSTGTRGCPPCVGHGRQRKVEPVAGGMIAPAGSPGDQATCGRCPNQRERAEELRLMMQHGGMPGGLHRAFSRSRPARQTARYQIGRPSRHTSSKPTGMATKLDKPLKREVSIAQGAFMLTISPVGLKLTEKGRRNGIELAWQDLINGEAALATALNASLTSIPKSFPSSRQPLSKRSTRAARHDRRVRSKD
jgi:hypothetical protein